MTTISHIPFCYNKIFGFNSLDMWFEELWFVEWWPKTLNETNLIPFYNWFFLSTNEQTWYSERHFPTFHDQPRYRLLLAVCEENYDDVDKVLEEGFDVNSSVELLRGLNAISVAAELNKLEMVHYL